jgi:hypothetical protein
LTGAIVGKPAARYTFFLTPGMEVGVMAADGRRPFSKGSETVMALPPIDWNPPRRRLRRFAWVLALLAAVAACREPDPVTDLKLRLASALVFATGTVWPGLFRWPYRILLALTGPLRLGFNILARLGRPACARGKAGS